MWHQPGIGGVRERRLGRFYQRLAHECRTGGRAGDKPTRETQVARVSACGTGRSGVKFAEDGRGLNGLVIEPTTIGNAHTGLKWMFKSVHLQYIFARPLLNWHQRARSTGMMLAYDQATSSVLSRNLDVMRTWNLKWVVPSRLPNQPWHLITGL